MYFNTQLTDGLPTQLLFLRCIFGLKMFPPLIIEHTRKRTYVYIIYFFRSFYSPDMYMVRNTILSLHNFFDLWENLTLCKLALNHSQYNRTSLKWTSSKVDTSLTRTKNFVPDEFLRNPLKQNLSKVETYLNHYCPA